MRSRSCCAISSVVLISACLAGDPKSDAKTVEVGPADYKQDRKEDEKKAEDSKEDWGYGGHGDDGTVPDMESGEPSPPDEPPPCPEGEGRMEDGNCASEEEFFGEQEALDAEALAQLQAAGDAKAQAEAQEKLIKQQIRQTYQAEKDLDEIIKDLKDKKKNKGKLDDPFGDGGKKEGL